MLLGDATDTDLPGCLEAFAQTLSAHGADLGKATALGACCEQPTHADTYYNYSLLPSRNGGKAKPAVVVAKL
jgi:hypothetical protein